MAYITVENTSRSVSVNETKAAVEFFLNRLLGNRLAKNVDVTVSYKSGLRKKTGGDGFAVSIDDGKNPREFQIELDRGLGYMNTLELLAHECVHVKQYARNELRNTVASGSIWNGKRYRKHTSDQYWDLPWEIEAYGKSRGLVSRFLAQKDC